MQKSKLTRIRSAFEYEGLVRQMIRDAKYAGRARILRFFAEELVPLVLSEFPRKIQALVPVPLHRKREWERRWNQAEVIAGQLDLHLGIPVRHFLTKIKKTMPQSSLSGPSRRRNLEGAFQCKAKNPLPRSLLLIDDVITTGSTLEECASVLRRCGARRVYGLTIARAVLK